MSSCLTAPTFLFLVFFLRVQSIDSARAWPASALSNFELPEVDGSAVDDICRIIVEPTSDTAIGTTTTTTTKSPITRKQVAATTKKPTVQSPPKKPDTRAPIRTQPAVNPAASLLHYLLAKSRGRTMGFQLLGSLNLGGYRLMSNSNRKIGSFSSEDSSDES